jgi:uncharacterized Zn finger protein (UPF0148 family)
MKSSRKEENGEVGVELKYCERCGGLWVRERGTGEVYCGNCRNEVADLPVPKKKPGRIGLPVLPKSVAERYARKKSDRDLKASGGAA